MARDDVAIPNECQRELARQLLACLGRDGAIRVCKANGWDGVLTLIQEDGAGADGTPRQ